MNIDSTATPGLAADHLGLTLRERSDRHHRALVVPGKILLAGEYSVLDGCRSFSSSVEAYLRVLYVPDSQERGRITVHSDHWTAPRVFHLAMANRSCGNSLNPVSQSLFRAAALSEPEGGAIFIDSQLDPTFGLGSSSALRLALLACLASKEQNGSDNERDNSEQKIWKAASEAIALQRMAQPAASGYDIVTQCVGGLVLFDPGQHSTDWPAKTRRIQSHRPLNEVVQAWVGGRGAPTTRTMAPTLEWLREKPCRMEDLNKTSESLIDAWIAWTTDDSNSEDQLRLIIEGVCLHRQNLEGAPSFPSQLFHGLSRLAGYDSEWTAKPTGAGGEDAILLVGKDPCLHGAHDYLKQSGWRKLPFDFGDAKAYFEPSNEQSH